MKPKVVFLLSSVLISLSSCELKPAQNNKEEKKDSTPQTQPTYVSGSYSNPLFVTNSAGNFYNNEINIIQTFQAHIPWAPIDRVAPNILNITKKHINKLKPWPDENSIIIDNDNNLIIITLCKEDLEKLRLYLEQLD